MWVGKGRSTRALCQACASPKGPLRIELGFQPEQQQKARGTRYEKDSVVSPRKGGLPQGLASRTCPHESAFLRAESGHSPETSSNLVDEDTKSR